MSFFTPFAFVKQAAAGGIDPDAQAFITAAGISGSNADAINTLVLDLKAYGLWTKMYVIYPLIGASDTSQKLNLLNPNTYTGSFKASGGGASSITFYNQGFVKLATGDYMDSGFIDNNTNWSYTNAHMSINYESAVVGDNGYVMGCTNSSPSPYNEYSKTGFYFFQNGSETKYFSPTAAVESGSIVVTVDPSNQQPTSYVNGANQRQAGVTSTNSHTSKKITVASVDSFAGSAGAWQGKVNFATIGQSLSSTNASNLHTAVNTYLTSIINPIATTWATTAGITNTSVISAVSRFVNRLQGYGIWQRMIAIYPMITDSDTSSTAKAQFTYNLVNPSLYAATYLNNNSTGAKGGLTNASGDTFITISPNTIGNNFVAGLYTNSDAASTDVLDMGVYKPAGDEYMLIACGRNKSGANADISAAPSGNYIYSAVSAPPFTGLFGIGGNSTTSYFYRRSSLLATGTYNNALRGDDFKIGIGSLLQNGTTAVAPTTKTYQFAFMSTFLDTTQFTYLSDAVNILQGDIDTIFSTTRKAY
jgi:hypothetical protein